MVTSKKLICTNCSSVLTLLLGMPYSGRDLAEDCCLFVHMLKMKTKCNCIHMSNAAESSGVCLMFISCQI